MHVRLQIAVLHEWKKSADDPRILSGRLPITGHSGPVGSLRSPLLLWKEITGGESYHRV